MESKISEDQNKFKDTNFHLSIHTGGGKGGYSLSKENAVVVAEALNDFRTSLAIKSSGSKDSPAIAFKRFYLFPNLSTFSSRKPTSVNSNWEYQKYSGNLFYRKNRRIVLQNISKRIRQKSLVLTSII